MQAQQPAILVYYDFCFNHFMKYFREFAIIFNLVDASWVRFCSNNENGEEICIRV